MKIQALLVITAIAVAAQPANADPLYDGFVTPPASARPWVWWHWMNGNISEEGARLDLEWMKRAGIGGFQLFEGDLQTPQVVERRVVWMSPAWKRALRSSAATADRLGLGFAITSSPGWSITGAPFVKPEGAMMKLVWSELHVAGGRRFSGRLPRPPAVAGPYQDILAEGAVSLRDFFQDVAVLAFPAERRAPKPIRVTSSSGAIDLLKLSDGRFGPAVNLPFARSSREAWILYDYGAPVTLRSLTIGLPGARGFGAPPPPSAALEASDDGRGFRNIASLPPSKSQARTASFAPATARWFRVRLSGTGGGVPPVRPGVVPMRSPPPPTSYAVSEIQLRRAARVHRAEEKAGFAAAADYYAIETPVAAVDRAPGTDQVLDLTGRMQSDGTLTWTPPPGRWTILRLGYSLTGKRNEPAPAEATGLEVDKLDAGAVRGYVNAYLDMITDAVGPSLIGKRGVTALLSDSIESGSQNWTPSMIGEFRKRQGYDPIPWLPTLAGIPMESAEKSDRFLWDFRKTIAELLAENHYGMLAEAARSRGLSYYSEALEDHRPQLGDDLAMRGRADVPMGAMWMTNAGGEPRQTLVADVQGAASVAHVLGKPIVAAESFTAFGAPWAFAPRHLKSTADLEFALGVNRIIIHTSPHQPFVDRRPGMALSPLLGQYFSRTETWAEMARGWTDYLARSSFLLQQGRFAADIAYFAGEEAPITALYGDKPMDDLPRGYGFDFISADALANAASVRENGSIETVGGMRYALLLLGGSSKRMTVGTLRRIRDLVLAGATVAGQRPTSSPSLADDEREFRDLTDELWGGAKIGGAISRGRIFRSADEALRAMRLQPDWEFPAGADKLAVLHRQLADGNLWFVSNRSGRPLKGDISLRIAGYEPEFWHADTGHVRPASYRIVDGQTIVPLDLAADEAVFLVFRKTTTSVRRILSPRSERPLLTIEGPWQLSFADGSRLPHQTLPQLVSWTESEVPSVRYYSGTAMYRRSLLIKPEWLKGEGRLMLDLGDVREVAEVRVNGVPAGTAWKPHFRVDVTDVLRPGLNQLEVRVANLWANRLIGDEQPNAVREAFTVGETYRADAPLVTSGLLGPVTLLAVRTR